MILRLPIMRFERKMTVRILAECRAAFLTTLAGVNNFPCIPTFTLPAFAASILHYVCILLSGVR